MNNFIEVRYLIAAVTLSEELNFTRAARRVKLSQSAFSRQIQELESHLNAKLFVRDHSKVYITDSGRAFVEEATLSLLHDERAAQFARAANAGVEATLNIGRSPYADPILTSTLLSIHLPLYPNLHVSIRSDFAPELAHGVMVAQLDLALIANPGPHRKLTTTKVAETRFGVAVPKDHPLLSQGVVKLSDLRDQNWILFERKAHPLLYDVILRRAHEESLSVKSNQTFLGIEEACHMVSEGLGVAFMTLAGAQHVTNSQVAVLPIDDPELKVDVSLASRAENRSKLVSEFARAFVKRAQGLLPPQMSLPMAG